MNALLALVAGRQATSPALVVENIEPSARFVSVQLIARLPHMTARRMRALDPLVHDLAGDIDGYSHHDAMLVTSGEPVRVMAGPDYVRIAFTVAPNNWRPGLALMAALAKDSKLTPPERPYHPEADAWNSALRPVSADRAARPEEIRELYTAIFRPSNLALGIGGPLTPGAATTDWQDRISTWTPLPASPQGRFDEDPTPATKNAGGMDSIDLYGPSFGPSDAALSTRLLTLIALGTGKGASLFRIARQRLQYSYRQEALLSPSPEGWQGRILLIMKPGTDLAIRSDTLRRALLDDVNGWTAGDLRRALGMADAVFSRDVPFSPFGFGPGGAPEGTLEGRTFLRAYWRLKTGAPWDPNALLSLMRMVRLEDLKETATEFLTSAKARLLPAG